MQAAAHAGYRRYDYKTALLAELLERFGDREVEVLDVGSGTSKDFVEVLQRFPRARYTGVEYRQDRLARARELLAGRPGVELVSGFGEDVQAGWADRFDLTVSLSVLEHVKHLREFLRSSVRVTRPGGWVVHRYDLGHALHSGLYETTKVFLCKHLPAVMPAKHFTTHPDARAVARILEEAGVEVREVRHSQLTSLKGMMNRLDWASPDAVELGAAIVETDRRLAAHMDGRLSTREMEVHFPTITVAGVKR
jgi:ubiquinone/menaquinone biosynthesis C-methylase UbiE